MGLEVWGCRCIGFSLTALSWSYHFGVLDSGLGFALGGIVLD